MKKLILTMLVTLVVAVIYSCKKDCICSVEGKGDVVRMHINDGQCIDIRYINDANGVEEVRVLCMEDTI